MTQLEIVEGITILVLTTLTIVGFYLAKSYHSHWREKQSKAFRMGGSQVKGDMYQVLGTFAVLNDYDQLMTLSSTSKQGSLDLLGVKADSIDFIEIKKKGALLQGPERKIRNLVEEKKVNYVIKDVDLPEGFEISDRNEKFDPASKV